MKKLKVGIASFKQYKDRTMAIARGEFKPKTPLVDVNRIKERIKRLKETLR